MEEMRSIGAPEMKVIGAPLSGGYSVPEGGIPESDLSAEVQAKLADIPEEAGEAGQVLQLDANGDPWWATPEAGTTPDSTMSDSSTNAVQNKVIKGYVDGVAEGKANIDGYYETLGAGTATNLKGQNIVNGEFVYRKSGGNDAVATGAAFLEGIKGNTIAWNQYIKSATISSSTGLTINVDNNGIIHLNGTATVSFFNPFETIFGYGSNALVNCPLGKYILIVDIIKNTDNIPLFLAALNNRIAFNYKTSDYTKSYKAVGDCTNTSLGGGFGFSNYGGSGTVFDDVQIQVNLIYLTPIYGAGNEPSTAAEFEADYFRWFGKPLTYEAYDTGSLRSVKMGALKTVGFNQFDLTTGKAKLLGGIEYYVSGAYTSLTIDGVAVTLVNNKFTPAQSCELVVTGGDATTCINISNANKNGTYEEYKGREAEFFVTSITGKVNGEGDSVTVFPDGMLSAGTVRDEIYKQGGKTYAVKRVGRVDLGSLDWTYSSTYSAFHSQLTPTVKSQGLGICAKYGMSVNSATLSSSDKYFTLGGNYYWEGHATIKDSSYTDATTFKTAMNGVYLNYELAEPIIYELDDFTLPVVYEVDGYGTEEIVPVAGAIAVAPILSLRYGVNAVGTLQSVPKGYISEGSMDDFLSSLGSAMNGTWTKTWNATTNKYDFTFTPNT